MDFCKLFNARTAKYKEGLELPVKLQAYNDRTFDFTVATPPASYFLKAAVRSYPTSVSSCPFWYWTAVGDFAHHFVWLSESKRVSDFVSHFERHEYRPPQLVWSFLRALRRLCAPEYWPWTSLAIHHHVMVQRRPAMPKWTTDTDLDIAGRNGIRHGYCTYCDGVARIPGALGLTFGPLQFR